MSSICWSNSWLVIWFGDNSWLMASLIYSMTKSILFVRYMYLKKRLCKKEVKISSKPGITKEIFAKMKYSDNLYSKLLKSKQPNPNLHYLYKKFTNRVVKDMKDSKTKGMCFHLPHVHVHLLCRVGIREHVSWSVSI